MPNKLPNCVSAAFIEWLERGGHKITLKKNSMVCTKNSKRGVIQFPRHEIQGFYELDEYLSGRYELFLTQWLKYGKSFIGELKFAMASKYFRAKHLNQLMHMAKVA